MNETEKDRILRMLADGTLKSSEAASLLAALAPDTAAKSKTTTSKTEAKVEKKEEEKSKPQTTEVRMQRPDGSHYTIEVPSTLFPMFMKMAGVYIKESARSAAVDAWDGFKIMTKNKVKEVKGSVTGKVRGNNKEATANSAQPTTPPSKSQSQNGEARRQVLQMLQNGRIGADDASRLIQQLDSLQEFQAKQE